MNEPEKTYRVVELHAENIKRLKVITIRPEGPVVPIAGPNDSGKTSTLDAISWAFEGGRAIQEKPIRAGQETALIRVDLGDMKVTRTFDADPNSPKGYTTSLKVQMADGSRPTRPQDMLSALIGEYSFDPFEFVRMKPDDQFDAVRALVPTVDFASIAAADKEDYDARTTANRRAKEARAQAEGITLPAGKVPKKVDLAPLEKQLGDAAEHNSLIERRRAKREQAQGRVDTITEDIRRLQQQIAALEQEADGIKAELAAADPLPEPIDVADVQAKLAAARAGNAVAETAARRAQLESDAAAFEAESKRLTEAMEAREAGKQREIAKAKMPVRGLTFGAGTVLLNGQPFAQASKAQQWIAAVEIAAALNPKLRVIRILDGSLLDSATRRGLAELAERLDLQVWIELVEPGDGAGFILEDGHLAGDVVEDEEEAV